MSNIVFVLFLQIKSPSANTKGLEIVKLPLLDTFGTFDINYNTEMFYTKLTLL